MMQSNSFSVFDDSEEYMYDYHSSYSSSSSSSSSSSFVDCTLSLGTPSTRLSSDHHHQQPSHPERGRSSSFFSNLFGKTSSSSSSQSHKTGSRGTGNSSGGDHLFSRRCANCDTTSTPLWRNGPRGPKSLCNACGIRYKKQERRASAEAAAAGNGGAAMEAQHVMNSSWVNHPQVPYYSAAYGDEFGYAQEEEDRNGDDDAGMSSYISWQRPSYVHDFTR